MVQRGYGGNSTRFLLGDKSIVKISTELQLLQCTLSPNETVKQNRKNIRSSLVLVGAPERESEWQAQQMSV